MSTDPGPFDLDAKRVILGPDGKATPKDVSPAFYAELDSEFDGFAGHALISRHEFAEDWSAWEMHPKGDEIVYLIAGAVDFVLWVEGAERVLRVDRPGDYIVVPRGVWHTARPLAPTNMLFVTPGQDTQIAETPGGAETT